MRNLNYKIQIKRETVSSIISCHQRLAINYEALTIVNKNPAIGNLYRDHEMFHPPPLRLHFTAKLLNTSALHKEL